jgi:hypothetical protein
LRWWNQRIDVSGRVEVNIMDLPQVNDCASGISNLFSVAPKQQLFLRLNLFPFAALPLPKSNQGRVMSTYTWLHRCGDRISYPPLPGAIMRTLSTLFAATFAAAFFLSSLAISAATTPVRPAKHRR